MNALYLHSQEQLRHTNELLEIKDRSFMEEKEIAVKFESDNCKLVQQIQLLQEECR
jgi:hypothetical protein